MNNNTNYSGISIKQDIIDVGVSKRALSMAKAIDRLPPGEFCIIVVKHNTKAVPWHTIIHKMDRIQVMDISESR